MATFCLSTASVTAISSRGTWRGWAAGLRLGLGEQHARRPTGIRRGALPLSGRLCRPRLAARGGQRARGPIGSPGPARAWCAGRVLRPARGLASSELFLRHEEARNATGVADERFYPAITSVLGQQFADLRQPTPGVIGKAS